MCYDIPSCIFGMNLIDFIRNIDQSCLGGYLYLSYRTICSNIESLKLPRITPLSKKTLINYGLLERYKFFQSAQYFLQVNRINGVYLEFGCHEVNTFRMALNTLGSHRKPNKITRFIAFDSFEGMPSPEGIDKQMIWKTGMNHTSLEKFLEITKKDAHRIEAVKGFYSDSLKSYKLSEEDKIALAYIDCDYYSSTVDVLNFLSTKISHGTIIAFDDWDCYYADPQRGQRKAFTEFKTAMENSFLFVKFRTIGSGGMSFICLERKLVGSECL